MVLKDVAEEQVMQWIPLLPRGAVVLALAQSNMPPYGCMPVWDDAAVEYIMVNVSMVWGCSTSYSDEQFEQYGAQFAEHKYSIEVLGCKYGAR